MEGDVVRGVGTSAVTLQLIGGAGTDCASQCFQIESGLIEIARQTVDQLGMDERVVLAEVVKGRERRHTAAKKVRPVAIDQGAREIRMSDHQPGEHLTARSLLV